MILRDPFGVADARNDDDMAAVGRHAVGDDVPDALATMAVAYSTWRLIPGIAVLPSNGANALDIATTTGSMMPSIAWS